MRETRGRPRCEATLAILEALKAPRTAREVAGLLQINLLRTSRILHRLVDREAIDITESRRMPGINKPVYVYEVRQAAHLAPGAALFGAFHQVISERRKPHE